MRDQGKRNSRKTYRGLDFHVEFKTSESFKVSETRSKLMLRVAPVQRALNVTSSDSLRSPNADSTSKRLFGVFSRESSPSNGSFLAHRTRGSTAVALASAFAPLEKPRRSSDPFDWLHQLLAYAMIGLVLSLIAFLFNHAFVLSLIAGSAFLVWVYKHMQLLEHLQRKDREGWLELQKKPASSRPNMLLDPSKKSLSLIIPVYNEEKRLPKTLDITLAYLEKRRGKEPLFTYELLIVNDGSRDGTERVVQQYIDKYGRDAIRLVNYPDRLNQGKGYAVKVGMSASRGRLLLMMDADGATEITDLDRLEADLNALIAKTYGPEGCPQEGRELGMAVGSRSHLQADAVSKRKWYRNILMHGFHALVILVIGNSVRDTQCGFKLFTRETARLLFYNQRLRRWCFDVELIRLAQAFKVPIAEVPVNWTEVPGSKLSLVRSSLRMASELFMLMLGYNVTGQWKAGDPRAELAGGAPDKKKN